MATTLTAALRATIAKQDAEIKRLRELAASTPRTTRAAQPVKPAVNPYKANRLARRALAAQMRKAGQPITEASWRKACKARGIVPVKQQSR